MTLARERTVTDAEQKSERSTAGATGHGYPRRHTAAPRTKLREAATPLDVSPPRYVGQSRFVHRWPHLMIVLGFAQAVTGAGPKLAGAAFMVVGGLVSAGMPWRFVVVDQGIGLWFGFGRRRFLARDDITVRVGIGPTVVYRNGAERFGVPLSDGLVERRRAELRSVLAEHGFRLA
jgi:hypothetical protein